MVTTADQGDTLGRERTPDDLPDIVKEALAEREAAIARGETVPEFDENGMEVQHG